MRRSVALSSVRRATICARRRQTKTDKYVFLEERKISSAGKATLGGAAFIGDSATRYRIALRVKSTATFTARAVAPAIHPMAQQMPVAVFNFIAS
jgi:hypothetical protein